jgi:hypothetical protein
MSDLPPSEDAVNDESISEPNLAARLLMLQQEHRELDQEIESLYEFPYRDQLQLQRLKKKKLLLKDAIERLKDDLIPDLNA